MKKPLCGLSHHSIIFLCFLFLLNSCKKSEQETLEKIDPSREKQMMDYANGPQQSNYTFEQFKSRVDLNKLGSLSKSFLLPTPSREKLMSVNTQDTYKGFALHTDSIKIIKFKDHTSYIFSVKQSSPRAITFQNLTIDEGPDGITIFVNTYVPTQNWINQWKKGHPGKFEGQISVTYLERPNQNAMIRSSVGANGKIASGGLSDKIALLDANGCDRTIYYYEVAYFCGSGLHGPGDSACALTGTGAAGYATLSSEIITCPNGSGGGGGGTTPVPPGEYDPCSQGPPQPTTNGLAGAGGKIMSGARGQQLMVHENPECYTQPQNDIRHELDAYPCASSLVNQMPNLSGSIAQIINNTFNKGDGINIIFQTDPRLRGTTTDGQILSASPNQYGTTVRIGLNPDILEKASKEYILVTMYHEAMHGYLTYKKQELGPTEFAAQFSSINSNGGRTLFRADEVHYELAAQNYLSGLRDVITGFNPNFDVSRAAALANYGIFPLSSGDAAINMQERDTTKPGYTGTKCPN